MTADAVNRTRRRLVATPCATGLGALLAACAAPQAPAPQRIEVPTYPPPPEPPRFVFERAIYSSADVRRDDGKTQFRRYVTGEQRTGEGFAKPYGVAVRRGRVYVTDTVRRSVMLFDFGAAEFGEFGTTDPGSLKLPIGIDVDDAGTVYVADSAMRCVMVYDAQGRWLRRIGDDDSLFRPAGVAVDPAGTRLHVVDIGGVERDDQGLRTYDARTGALLARIGRRGDRPGEFNLPRDVAVGRDGTLFVVDGANFRVQVLDAQGAALRTFGTVGRQGGMFSRPKEVAIDRDFNVYVVDTAFGNVQIFDESGRLLLDVGTRGSTDGPGRYMLPSGVAVDDDGRLYLVDQYFRKVEVFRPASLPVDGGFLGRHADTSAEARRLALGSRQ